MCSVIFAGQTRAIYDLSLAAGFRPWWNFFKRLTAFSSTVECSRMGLRAQIKVMLLVLNRRTCQWWRLKILDTTFKTGFTRNSWDQNIQINQEQYEFLFPKFIAMKHFVQDKKMHCLNWSTSFVCKGCGSWRLEKSV